MVILSSRLVLSELPESMLLDFDCGARIKLGFAAEFSNVLVIYTHIVKKPEDMTSCQANVTDFSQVRWGWGGSRGNKPS